MAKFLEKIFGTHSSRELKKIEPIADKVMALEDEYRKLTDEQLREKTDEFKKRVANGETLIYNASRLRIKESDRIESTVAMLKALGAEAEATYDGMRIFGKQKLSGGKVKSYNDHRIAMSAAVAAAVSDGNIKITGAEAVRKSYGDFFEKFETLGADVTKTEVK